MVDLNNNFDQLKVFLVVVDNTSEMRLALRYASLRAKKQEDELAYYVLLERLTSSTGLQ